jgi:hypothetical protein
MIRNDHPGSGHFIPDPGVTKAPDQIWWIRNTDGDTGSVVEPEPEP